MALNLERFNKIIDLSFYTASGSVKTILCPRHGVKPDIQINGTYGASLELYQLHVVVKNLYLDLQQEQYTRLVIRAGYINNLITIEATIYSMFRENPGPDGTTVIQCQLGKLTSNWLSATVQLQFDKGTNLLKILKSIQKSLGATDVKMGLMAKTCVLEAPFQFDGSARNALAELEQLFISKKLQILMQGTTLCALCLTQGDFIKSHIVQYMSAPPQMTPGDEAGQWHTMITAPWMPEVLPGDLLVIPSQVYINNGVLVGGINKTQMLEVTEMSFHFGTKGSINQMTCSGFIVR